MGSEQPPTYQSDREDAHEVCVRLDVVQMVRGGTYLVLPVLHTCTASRERGRG